MTTATASQWLKERLMLLYDESEAALITSMVLEQLTGNAHAAKIELKDRLLDAQQLEQLTAIHRRLARHEPVQYVLNKAWFYDFPLYVDAAVLIPRPETAELANWIIGDVRSSKKDVMVKTPTRANGTDELKILDVGTGSGCIALALKKKLPLAEVWGCDNSEAALNVARRNASELDLRVDFVGLDFLDVQMRKQLPTVDIIVSNPPYIPASEKETIALNVLLHEPHGALFVPDNDPLIFYRTIAQFGHQRLYPGGAVYLETHEALCDAVVQLMTSEGYTTTAKKDMQGKDRMVKAVKDQTNDDDYV
jgi:release factor glutamine methyltransferase